MRVKLNAKLNDNINLENVNLSKVNFDNSC